MDGGYRTPEEHSGDWRLAARDPGSARRLRVQPEGMAPVLLVADEEGGWWAVGAGCRACGAALDTSPDGAGGPAGEVRCAACHTPHGPEVDGCEVLATLVVDDEIYLLASQAGD